MHLVNLVYMSLHFPRNIRANFQGQCHVKRINFIIFQHHPLLLYKGADKSLARPRRKQATATEDFDVHISYL